jgi:hypothetical protein
MPHQVEPVDGGSRMCCDKRILVSRQVLRQASIAGRPGGSTHRYFQSEGSWEAEMREQFALLARIRALLEHVSNRREFRLRGDK